MVLLKHDGFLQELSRLYQAASRTQTGTVSLDMKKCIPYVLGW
jgi:hypothetical protein